jgi:hypothetical protein
MYPTSVGYGLWVMGYGEFELEKGMAKEIVCSNNVLLSSED